MAGAFRIAFAIEGDASKAMAAISKLAGAVDRLSSVLEKMDKTSQKTEQTSRRAGQAAAQAGEKARGAWDLATTSANRYANALQKTQNFTMRTSPVALLPATAGGGGGAIPPITPVATASAGMFFNVFQRGQAVLSAVQTKIQGIVTKIVTGFNQGTAAVSKFVSTLQTGAVAAISGVTQKLSGLLKGISAFSTWSRNVFMTVTDSFRMVAQGLTNIGRALFFFVSLPLGMFLGGLIRGAIDFDDAMVRVGKTTGLWGEELKALREELRETSKMTVSSQVELAGIAEVIGQLGVTSGAAITDLTRIFEMLNVATELSGEEVANSMGKIANAFKINLNTNTKWVWQAANALNALENETAAAAGEIIDATFNFAQAAAAIGMSAADTFAYGATLVSMGLDANEAGTALKNMGLYAGRNADKIAVAMRSNEKYNTTAKVMTALNEDASQVFIDMANAAAEGGVSMEEFVTLMDIGNMRGGRALVAMANNMDLLNKNIAISNTQWEKQGSLLLEYERALSSTKSQMAILKNNVQDLGITIGDTLLPVINRMIQVLVPAVQMAGEWFKGLDKGQQMMIIGFLAALVVLPPILFFVQQIFHGLLLMAFGFGTILKLVPLLISGVQLLIGFLPALAAFFFSWPGVVLVAVVAILKILAGMGVDVAGFFTNLANKASEWGTQLMSEYASGLAKALGIVLRVIAAIANVIASFFKSSSPPKKGPLSTIDQWGSAIMRTFLEGFLNADFDILNQVGRTIQRILTMGVSDEDMPGALKKVAQARVNLAKLLDIYRKTGKISQGVMAEVVNGLGDMAGDVSKLVELWVKYEDIQRRIAELEERRKDVTKGYSDEIKAIGASNMSLEEKVAAIRQAQFARDDELRTIDKQAEGLEEQSDAAKEQLEYQKAFVDTLLDQDDLMTRIAEALEDIAGGAEDLGAELGEGLGDALGDIEEEMANVGDMWDGIITRFAEGKKLFEGFLAGFTGEAPDPSMGGYGAGESEVGDIYTALYKLGQRVRTIYDTILTWKDAILEVWATVTEFFAGEDSGKKEGEAFGKNFKDGMVEGFTKNFSWSDIWNGLNQKADTAGEERTSFMRSLFGLDERGIAGWWEDSWKAGEMSGPVIEWLQKIAAPVNAWWSGTFVPNFWENFKVSLFAGFPLLGLINGVNEKIQEMVDGVADILGVDSGSSTVLLDIGKAIVQGLIDGIIEGANGSYQKITEWVQQMIDIGKEILGISSPSTVFFDIGMDVIQGLIDGMDSLLATLIQFVADMINGENGIIQTITGFLGDMITVGANILQGLFDGMISTWTSKIWPWLQARAADIANIFKVELKEDSPSKVLADIGENAMLGFLGGMEKIGRKFDTSVGDLAMQAGVGGVSKFGPDLAFAGAGAGDIIVNIHDPVVREDADLKRLADMVSKELSKKLRMSSNFGGHTVY